MPLREELALQGRWLFRWRSYLPLLLVPILVVALREPEPSALAPGRPLRLFYLAFCLLVSALGMTVRCLTIGFAPRGTSGRNTRRQIAESLNQTCMYSIVRHPLYLGNFLISLGIVLFVQSWWFVAVFILLFWLYYERIVFTEEEFLRDRFGEIYLGWAGETPAFVPRFRNWHRQDTRMSVRNILGREYPILFAVITSFALLDALSGVLRNGRLRVDVGWAVSFAVGMVAYLTLRILKKTTKILEIDAR